MTPQNFAYWLKGFFEMTDAEKLTPEQVKMIREHLDLVFTKKTHTLNELQQHSHTFHAVSGPDKPKNIEMSWSPGWSPADGPISHAGLVMPTDHMPSC